MNRLKSVYLFCLYALIFLLWGCSSSRHVPQGMYLLDKVSVSVDSCNEEISQEELMSYIRQQPNHKILWSMKLRLGIYNLSGKDTTRWWNRWIRKLGEPPVIYDSALTIAGEQQLEKALINKGYLKACVSADSSVNEKKRKIQINYTLSPGTPYVIRSIQREYPNEEIRKIVESSRAGFAIKEGDLLDRSLLEAERERITRRMRNRGYFSFVKENISFNADTTEGKNDVELTMKVTLSGSVNENTIVSDSVRQASEKFLIRKVIYVTDFDPIQSIEERRLTNSDTVHYKDIEILYGKKHYLKPQTLWENNFITPGQLYRESAVERTYKALSRLEILKFINIRFEPVGRLGDVDLLDAFIMLTPDRSQSFALELEGTNSEGDLGVALGLSYSHRNAGKGGEILAAKLRGAYESLSGNLEGLINNRYMEYSVDLSLTFPKFKAPFFKQSFKRRVNATTGVNLSINYQERPEYTRIISTAGWNYRWTERGTRNRHTFTPIDVNYVYLPKSTYSFIDEIAPDNPLLRYSYENHFIMRLGYSFYHTNKRQRQSWLPLTQDNIWTVRINTEIAGNLLFAISNILKPHQDYHVDPYKVFGIHYAQYFKIEGDYAFTHIFDERNALACHVGLGVGYPYGNSVIMPFEKRFYGGGANGVRGWAVRSLGPGRYPGSNSVSDFINQCGDIMFDLSVEYRAHLFWVVELGAFIDAGNIWTIKNYPAQPDGMFTFSNFYKELAAAYGLGLRLDFDYFLLRFDLGMKAHNPAIGQKPWPLISPNWHRDHSFHFSIGYPF